MRVCLTKRNEVLLQIRLRKRHFWWHITQPWQLNITEFFQRRTSPYGRLYNTETTLLKISSLGFRSRDTKLHTLLQYLPL